MTGVLLIAVFGLWLLVAIFATRWVAQRFKSAAWKAVVCVAIFPALLIAPVLDELIGMQQFSYLCSRYAFQNIDEEHAMNRRVLFERRARDNFAEGTAVRIRIDPKVYRDAETGRILVSYSTLHADGGWLIRTLGISETGAPLLFESGCAPIEQDAFKKKFNITVIN